MNTASDSVGSEAEACGGGLTLLALYNKALFFKHPLSFSQAVGIVPVYCASPVLQDLSEVDKTLLTE